MKINHLLPKFPNCQAVWLMEKPIKKHFQMLKWLLVNGSKPQKYLVVRFQFQEAN